MPLFQHNSDISRNDSTVTTARNFLNMSLLSLISSDETKGQTPPLIDNETSSTTASFLFALGPVTKRLFNFMDNFQNVSNFENSAPTRTTPMMEYAVGPGGNMVLPHTMEIPVKDWIKFQHDFRNVSSLSCALSTYS